MTARPKAKDFPFRSDLTFEVECRAYASVSTTTRHPVTITSQWAVHTPHDLASERIAAGLGGYCSCVELVDTAIPAFRAALPLLLRHQRLALERDGYGRWFPPRDVHIAKCCVATGYSTVQGALTHLRGAEHLARANAGRNWQFEALLAAAADSYHDGQWPIQADHETAGMVREITGVADLWRAGIHPDDILALAAPARATPEALPEQYFIEMAYGDVDVEWLGTVLPHRPDGDTAAWLASIRGPRHAASADEWARWLDFGIPRDDARSAVESGLASDFVNRVASMTAWSPRETAQAWLAFVNIGCRPTPDHFATMRDHGIERPRPSGPAVSQLVDQVKKLRKTSFRDKAESLTRTELAVMLVIAGNKPAVVNAIERNVRFAAQLRSTRGRR